VFETELIGVFVLNPYRQAVMVILVAEAPAHPQVYDPGSPLAILEYNHQP
jgi:hypothetical protein